MKKRVKRIVSSTMLMSVMDLFFLGNYKAFREMPLPGKLPCYFSYYWFCSAILIYYILFYLIFRNVDDFRKKKKMPGLCFYCSWWDMSFYVFLVDKSVFSVELTRFS